MSREQGVVSLDDLSVMPVTFRRKVVNSADGPVEVVLTLTGIEPRTLHYTVDGSSIRQDCEVIEGELSLVGSNKAYPFQYELMGPELASPAGLLDSLMLRFGLYGSVPGVRTFMEIPPRTETSKN